jgi:hypothetical protein
MQEPEAKSFVKGVSGETRNTPPNSQNLLVCVPSYNEAENIDRLLTPYSEALRHKRMSS